MTTTTLLALLLAAVVLLLALRLVGRTLALLLRLALLALLALCVAEAMGLRVGGISWPPSPGLPSPPPGR